MKTENCNHAVPRTVPVLHDALCTHCAGPF